MRVAVIASGSRGDVEPYVALSKGLQKAGHGVRVVTHENYRALVEGQGLELWPVRAGAPSLVVPFFADQPFWGRRVSELGVGPRPISQGQLTVGRLAEAIRTMVSDEAMRGRAAALGARIRGEDGVACAVDVLEQIAKQCAMRGGTS